VTIERAPLPKVVKGVFGFVLGGVVGLGLLIATCVGLWETRETWFDKRRNGDDLQYFDLAAMLMLGSAGVAVPVFFAGGLLGSWMASRETPPPVGGPTAGGEQTDTPEAEPSAAPDPAA
jgi:hypothetical protein